MFDGGRCGDGDDVDVLLELEASLFLCTSGDASEGLTTISFCSNG